MTGKHALQEYAARGEMCLQAAYTGNLEEAEEFKKEIQEVFPGHGDTYGSAFLKRCLPYWPWCTCSSMLKKSYFISIKYRNKDTRSLKHEEDYGTDGGRAFRSI